MTPIPLFNNPLLALLEEALPLQVATYLEAQRMFAAVPAPTRQPRARVRAERRIAVVPLMGSLSRRGNVISDWLGWSTYEGIAADLEALTSAADVDTIVLRVDSPGGNVNGVEDAAQAVADAAKKKRVIAVADGLMASAAYWIASQATEIVAAPGSEVGGIGIIAIHMDQSAALAKDGFKATVLTTAPFKAEGHPYAPLEVDARAALQERLDAQHALFVGRVASGRGVPPERVRTGFGQGRVLPTERAVREGLADRVERYVDAVDRAVALAGRV